MPSRPPPILILSAKLSVMMVPSGKLACGQGLLEEEAEKHGSFKVLTRVGIG